MPSGAEIISFFEGYYANYGYLIVFIAAVIESTLIFGWFFPGMYLALMATLYSQQGTLSLPLVVLFAALGWLTGSSINYAFGRFGWYKIFLRLGLNKLLEKGQRLTDKYGRRAIFLSHSYPSFSPSVSVVSGIFKVPFSTFFLWALSSILFWTSLYAIVGYLAGYQRKLVESILDYIAIPFTVIAVFWLIRKVYNRLNKKDQGEILP